MKVVFAFVAILAFTASSLAQNDEAVAKVSAAVEPPQKSLDTTFK